MVNRAAAPVSAGSVRRPVLHFVFRSGPVLPYDSGLNTKFSGQRCLSVIALLRSLDFRATSSRTRQMLYESDN